MMVTEKASPIKQHTYLKFHNFFFSLSKKVIQENHRLLEEELEHVFVLNDVIFAAV